MESQVLRSLITKLFEAYKPELLPGGKVTEKGLAIEAKLISITGELKHARLPYIVVFQTDEGNIEPPVETFVSREVAEWVLEEHIRKELVENKMHPSDLDVTVANDTYDYWEKATGPELTHAYKVFCEDTNEGWRIIENE